MAIEPSSCGLPNVPIHQQLAAGVKVVQPGLVGGELRWRLGRDVVGRGVQQHEYGRRRLRRGPVGEFISALLDRRERLSPTTT